MKKFYYVDTGHRVGLDRFRRAVAVLKALGDDEVTLLCSDFRIAHEARQFGIKKSVGIDVVRNIINIAERGDKIIFDSAEANPLMLEDMRSYFSTFIRVSDDPQDTRAQNEYLLSPYYKDELTYNDLIVDEQYFGEFEKNIELGFFFGDDDYEKDLQKNLDFLDGLDITLMSGFYYFLDYEEMLQKRFSSVYEFENYEQFITSTNILLTASPQAVLESLASGSKPIYLQREDYPQGHLELFKTLNIPIIHHYDKHNLKNIINQINSHPYKKIQSNSNKLAKYFSQVSHFYQI